MLPGFNQYCRELMCLTQGHNMVTLVRTKLRTSGLGVRRSTTTTSCSLQAVNYLLKYAKLKSCDIINCSNVHCSRLPVCGKGCSPITIVTETFKLKGGV